MTTTDRDVAQQDRRLRPRVRKRPGGRSNCLCCLSNRTGELPQSAIGHRPGVRPASAGGNGWLWGTCRRQSRPRKALSGAERRQRQARFSRAWHCSSRTSCRPALPPYPSPGEPAVSAKAQYWQLRRQVRLPEKAGLTRELVPKTAWGHRRKQPGGRRCTPLQS